MGTGARDIKSFPLAWRWTSPSHTVLPTEILNSMHPLPTEEAAKAYGDGRQLSRRNDTAVTATHLAEETESTRTWLSALPISPDQQVFVAWDPSTAITLPWKAFVMYWDAFCYPSSDDLFVFPSDKTAALAWSHEEVFRFAGHAV